MFNSILMQINHFSCFILLNVDTNQFTDVPWYKIDWVIRIGIILMSIAIGFWLYTGVKNNLNKTLEKTLFSDFIKPALVYISLTTIELIYKSSFNWSWNLTLNYYEITYYCVNIVFVIFWLKRKTRVNGYISMLFVLFGVFFIFTFKERAGTFILNHILYEFLPIFLAFTLISFTEVAHLHAEEEKDELNFWTTYIYELAKAENSISAFNTVDYDNFVQPLGLRYFAEQIKEISCRPFSDREIYKSISETEKISNTEFTDRKRIFVIKEALTTESYEITAITKYGKLTDQQRNFKAIYLIHKSLKIQMFCVSEHELKSFIIENLNIKNWNVFKNLRIKKVTNKMDKLVLNDTVYTVGESKGSLCFIKSTDEELNDLLKKALVKFSDDKYNINKYLDEQHKIL